MTPRTPRQYLGDELTRARIAAGFTSQQALAAELHVDRSVVGKAETGERPPSAVVLKDWAATCGIDEALYARMVEFVRSADGPIPDWFAPYLERERTAHTIRIWQPLIIPGLLQTAAYARALFLAEGASPERADELVAERLGRQEILDRADATNVVAVLDESVLHKLIGSPEIMHEALTHLAVMAERPDISVSIVPASIGANAGLSGGFQLASCDGSADVLNMIAVADVTEETRSLVRRAVRIFDLVRDEALPCGTSRTFILEAAEQWNTR
jgi:transcriptional regulator with XRE-family HTH domain